MLADNPWISWPHFEVIMISVLRVVKGLIDFTALRSRKGLPPVAMETMQQQQPQQQAGAAASSHLALPNNTKYKTSMCRDLTLRGKRREFTCGR